MTFKGKNFSSREKKILCLFVALILGGFYSMYVNRPSLMTPEQISANPAVLNHATLRGKTITGFTLKNATLTGTKFANLRLEEAVFENIVFVNATFEETDIIAMRFTNVLFKDCTFINADMREGSFTDVKFSGGYFSYPGDPATNIYYIESNIRHMRFKNVIFDGVKTDNFSMEALRGTLTMKNMRDINKLRHNGPLILGSSMTLCIDNCEINGESFAVLYKGSTVYATNSTFIGSSLGGVENKAMYIENCKILDLTYIGDYKTIVVKNSTVSTHFYGNGTLFIENCEFVIDSEKLTIGSAFKGEKGSLCFVLGSKNTAPWFFVMGGSVYLYDLVLENLDLMPRMSYGQLRALHLRNVDIHGGDWQRARMEGGQWENVRIYPEVRVRDTRLGEVRMHNVTFPEGNPWRGTEEVGIQPVYSQTPFDWPEVHVPTPEELGLIRELEELPSVTGGPRP